MAAGQLDHSALLWELGHLHAFLDAGGHRVWAQIARAAVRALRECQLVHGATETRSALTKRQADVLAYVRSYVALNGYAPLLDEIADGLGLRAIATISEHLRNLERKGWIRRDYNVERGITLIGRAPAGVTP